MTPQEFHTYFVVSPPDHSALSTERESSYEMQREVLGEVINVADGQARTDLAHVDQRATFENAGTFSIQAASLTARRKNRRRLKKSAFMALAIALRAL
jgi:hypothetical protein